MEKMCRILCCVLFLSLATATPITRSTKEIEDFSQFLKSSVNGRPQEPLTLELADLQSEWERSGKFEGDIVLSEEQQSALVDDFSGVRNAILDTTRLWTNKIVYYEISSVFNANQVAAIDAAAKELNTLSCVQFRRNNGHVNFVIVTGDSTGCHSKVGMRGKTQDLNLTPNTIGTGCFKHGNIMHEFLHTAGFFHAHSTPNRDEYIKVVYSKITPGKEHAFQKYTTSEVTDFGVKYDYGSILHYGEYAFSVDGSKTIVPLKTTTEQIGQKVKLSAGDITKLNKLYKCPGF